MLFSLGEFEIEVAGPTVSAQFKKKPTKASVDALSKTLEPYLFLKAQVDRTTNTVVYELSSEKAAAVVEERLKTRGDCLVTRASKLIEFAEHLFMMFLEDVAESFNAKYFESVFQKRDKSEGQIFAETKDLEIGYSSSLGIPCIWARGKTGLCDKAIQSGFNKLIAADPGVYCFPVDGGAPVPLTKYERASWDK